MKTIRLNNVLEIPQIGVGTWTLRGERPASGGGRPF